MLVLLVVQSSNELRMMEQYAAPLLSIAKADDTNAKLQGKYYQCPLKYHAIYDLLRVFVCGFFKLLLMCWSSFVLQSLANGWSLWKNFALSLAAFPPS